MKNIEWYRGDLDDLCLRIDNIELGEYTALFIKEHIDYPKSENYIQNWLAKVSYEKAWNQSVNKMIKEYGEPAFRELIKRHLQQERGDL